MYILVPKKHFHTKYLFLSALVFLRSFTKAFYFKFLLTSDDEAEHLRHGLADAKGRLRRDGGSAPKTHGTAEQTGQH